MCFNAKIIMNLIFKVGTVGSHRHIQYVQHWLKLKIYCTPLGQILATGLGNTTQKLYLHILKI